jgi:6-phosphogluconate dehydrogenase (decarboxylating)
LTRVDAYVGERLWIRRLEDLKFIWVALGWVVSERVDMNTSDEELDDGMAEVERLRDRLRELMDRFEAMKLAALRGVMTPRAAILNNTAAVLRALDPAARGDVLISVGRGVDVREALRQIREKASAGRALEDAGRGGGSPGAGQEEQSL